MALTDVVKQSKKSHSSVQAAVAKAESLSVNAKARLQSMGGAVAVANALFAAVNSAVTITVGQAIQWLENALKKLIPAVMGFLVKFLGLGDKNALKLALEQLT
ncbi:MAG: hypothetical protein KIT83_08380 [Bryobacterales bacterium]|nr:hypothetical protein [Bryobacterales bacterium]